jgi:hypothetical protein
LGSDSRWPRPPSARKAPPTTTARAAVLVVATSRKRNPRKLSRETPSELQPPATAVLEFVPTDPPAEEDLTLNVAPTVEVEAEVEAAVEVEAEQEAEEADDRPPLVDLSQTGAIDEAKWPTPRRVVETPVAVHEEAHEECAVPAVLDAPEVEEECVAAAAEADAEAPEVEEEVVAPVGAPMAPPATPPISPRAVDTAPPPAEPEDELDLAALIAASGSHSGVDLRPGLAENRLTQRLRAEKRAHRR